MQLLNGSISHHPQTGTNKLKNPFLTSLNQFNNSCMADRIQNGVGLFCCSVLYQTLQSLSKNQTVEKSEFQVICHN